MWLTTEVPLSNTCARHCFAFNSHVYSACMCISQVNQGCFSWVILMRSVLAIFLLGITQTSELNLGSIQRNYSIARVPCQGPFIK